MPPTIEVSEATATGRSRRALLLVGALTLAGASAFATWRFTSLSGLPDIGEPFDVAAFTEKPVPDDANAFTLYREAARLVDQDSEENFTYDWRIAGPEEKAWLERNRKALEVWRRGTERDQTLYIPARSITISTQLPVVSEIRKLARMARLEATRLESVGDLEGAWRWHRAAFRASRHLGRHSTAIERLVGVALHQNVCVQLNRWAADPLMTPDLLRPALRAIIADDAATGPISDNLKVEYLAFVKTYDDPDLTWMALNDPNGYASGQPSWLARQRRVFSVARRLKREPERSKRVTRLIYANLLAYCDLPPDRRPPIAVTLASGGPAIPLFATDESAPPAARALTPEAIGLWFDSTLIATDLPPAFFKIIKVVDAERVVQTSLVMNLATRLYELEHGESPRPDEELVGPSLRSLPEGDRSTPADSPTLRTSP
jgi:hypothetical protein